MSELHQASTEAEALANCFRRMNGEVIAAVASWSEADWRTFCPEAQWSAAIVAHHIAAAHAWLVDAMRALATGQPFPAAFTDWEIMHADNARHAEQHATCSREETLELLRDNGAQAERFVRDLNSKDLERSAPSPLDDYAVLSIRQWVEDSLILHARNHLRSIRATIQA